MSLEQFSVSFDENMLLTSLNNIQINNNSFFNIDELAASFAHESIENSSNTNNEKLNDIPTSFNFEFDDDLHVKSNPNKVSMSLTCAFNQCYMRNNLFLNHANDINNNNHIESIIQLACSNDYCRKLFNFHQLCYQVVIRDSSYSSNRFNRNRSNSIEYSNRVLNCPTCTCGTLKLIQMSSFDNDFISNSLPSNGSYINFKDKQKPQQKILNKVKQQEKMGKNNRRRGSLVNNNQTQMLPLNENDINLNGKCMFKPTMTLKQQQQQNYSTQPMNMPIKNRNRTLSNGSNGSYSACSSLTSSIGANSPFMNSSCLLKKLSLNQVLKETITNSACSSDSGLSSATNNTHQNLSSPTSSSTSSSSLSYQDKDKVWFPGINEKNASSGSILNRRQEWNLLKDLPLYKQNSYHTRLEDDGPFGNDDIRGLVLSHFSTIGVREIECMLCNAFNTSSSSPTLLTIYDRFPLLDGSLFISPIKYNLNLNKFIKINLSNKEQYIYAACIKCLNHWSNNKCSIKCKYCKMKWRSESLQIGTLYKYDILSAYPCCNARLTCNKCKTQLCDLNINPLPYFSSYSQEIECFNCKSIDCHFIKQIDTSFISV